MSIVFTNLGFKFEPIQSTSPLILDNKFKPNKIMHEWIWHLDDVGDANAGAGYCDINFGANFDQKHYIVITDIFYRTNANASARIDTNTDCWDNLYHPGFANAAVSLWAGSAYYPSNSDLVQKIIYLGRPRVQDSNPGVCVWNFTTNTDTCTYRAVIKGYTLERPLPNSSIIQI